MQGRPLIEVLFGDEDMDKKAKFTANRLGTGRYMYRTYLIEDLSSYSERKGQKLWLITEALMKERGEGPCDAAGSLAEAKAMIDSWMDK